MTPPSTKPFRFLDLPAEVRKLIYEELFASSVIAIIDGPFHIRISDSHGRRYLKEVDVTNYHCAIPMTSRIVRDESLALLDRATTLELDGDVADGLVRYLDVCSEIVLSRIHRLRFTQRYYIYGSEIREMKEYLSSLKTVEIYANLVTEGWSISETFRILGGYEDQPDQMIYKDELGGITSIDAFRDFAKNWIKEAYQVVPISQVKMAVIGSYPAKSAEWWNAEPQVCSPRLTSVDIVC